jgi:hypothetical protein
MSILGKMAKDRPLQYTLLAVLIAGLIAAVAINSKDEEKP